MARSASFEPGPRSSADRLGRVVAPGDQGWSASLHFFRTKDSPGSTDVLILPGFSRLNKEIQARDGKDFCDAQQRLALKR